jgi:hypothetical protein
VAAGLEARPLCGTPESADQVLTINLAFESSAGIHTVPDDLRQTRTAEDGSALATIRDMAASLRLAHARRALFSDLDLPWVRAGKPVQAAGYAQFPSPALAAALAQHAS